MLIMLDNVYGAEEFRQLYCHARMDRISAAAA